jgi:hypothetical protein
MSYLINYGPKKVINNIQDLGLPAKCGCIMRAIVVFRRTTDILVCLLADSRHF